MAAILKLIISMKFYGVSGSELFPEAVPDFIDKMTNLWMSIE